MAFLPFTKQQEVQSGFLAVFLYKKTNKYFQLFLTFARLLIQYFKTTFIQIIQNKKIWQPTIATTALNT